MNNTIKSDYTRERVNKLLKELIKTNKTVLFFCAGNALKQLFENYPELNRVNIIGIVDSNTEKTG